VRPDASSSSASPISRSATLDQAAKNCSVPASPPAAAASRIGRHASSTSPIVPPLYSVISTDRFQT
jgi:hypothetical protein